MTDPSQQTEDIFALTGKQGTDSATNPAPTAVEPVTAVADRRLRPGDRFGDFLILRELGEGGFATVFLAHEVTLDRRVALKVSEKRGLVEGQTLAELEHEHIVRVHAQFTDAATNRHCLSLQYVPGSTLHGIIQRTHRNSQKPETGQDLLDAIAVDERDDVPFDPAGLRNREALARCGYVAAVCRIGSQLAEALQFAHRRGILHCDIKPANVLVNPYGRPLLADFNIAVNAAKQDSGKRVGGTLGYMPPEQLAMWLREPNQKVDERSDLYALGVIVFEMITGRLPFPIRQDAEGTRADRLLLSDQRAFSNSISWENEHIPPVVERILRRCLHPDPAKRYADAGELARAFANAFELLNIQHSLPRGGNLTQRAERNPVGMFIALTLLPHIVGTIVNIAYNTTEITLIGAQKSAFITVILVYNAIIYPLCFSLLVRLLWPAYRGWKLCRSGAYSPAEIDALRERVLRSANYVSAVALAGWIPGGLLFPWCIDLLAGSVLWKVYAHFILSFTLSGLIAVVYSYFGIQFVVLRVVYPQLGNADARDSAAIREELDRAARRLVIFQGLAAVVPLVGAVLLVVSASGEMTLSFRLLVTTLIVVGMIGLGIAVRVTRRLTEIIGLLRGEQS
jgi:eukaryotic-like serine/threonine-protein kinase